MLLKKQSMKDKKEYEELKINSKNKSFIIVILIVILTLYWFYLKTKQETMGYPSFLFTILFWVLFLGLLIATLSRDVSEIKTNKDKTDKVLFILFNVIKKTVIAFFISGILLLPFNLYNKSFAKNNPIETIKCKITGLTDYSKNSSFYYEYKGEEYIIYAHRAIMSKIYIEKNQDEYWFVAKVRKGLLDSYVIEDWDIVHK